MTLACRAALAASLLFLCAAHADSQPVRDGAKPSASGTAVLAGVVVSDDQNPRPIRRVRVSAMASDRQTSRTAVTDDAGRFSFAGLPAGRYQLVAAKQGFVQHFYGARRPNRPGTAIVVADGQRIANLTVRLTKGAVVTGTLLDHSGDPLPGVLVYAMVHRFAITGQRQLGPAGSGMTDDRGQYRIWGLAAGDYLVSASPMFGGQGIRSDVEIARTTDADVKRALSEVAGGRGSASASASPSAASAERASAVGYAAVYYPGVFGPSQAATIRLAAGEERAGVDFPLSLVPTARVEGTLALPEGFVAQQIMVQLVSNSPGVSSLDMFRRSTPAANGAFSFAGVPPGTYAVIARGLSSGTPGTAAPARGPATPPQPTHYARADVAVDGVDVTGVALTLQPGLVLSGRIRVEGTTTPLDLTRVRVQLTAVQSHGDVLAGVPFIQADAAGAFSMPGITSGRYRLGAIVPSPRPDAPAWQLKSATVNDVDAADLPVEIQANVVDAVITITDRVSSLDGTVQDATGQPAPECQIVAFPADRTLWSGGSRRLRTAKPAADGTYTIPGLPPGEYLIAAALDMEPGEWFDSSFLEQLARGALKISVGEGEKKTQDLRLGGQAP
jgi:hypothetical protein